MFLSFLELWDLIDDGLFTCGHRKAFTAVLHKPHTLTLRMLVKLLYFSTYMQKQHAEYFAFH